MKRFFCLLLAYFWVASWLSAQYVPDSLCVGYLSHVIQQPDDYEGRVICTVVKKPNLSNVHRAIVYVHGYNDYFFQTPLGDSVQAHGYNFYAVDLRKYGRSLLPNQDAFYCKNGRREYFQDIDSTIALARREGNDTIVLMGHSTGGLTTSYYVKNRQEKSGVNALVLNSPFLDWNLSPVMERLGVPLVSFMGIFLKRVKIQGTSSEPSCYSQSLLSSYHGEWNFNEDLKMPFGHTIRSGWTHAITRAQKHARRRCRKIEIPVLVMSSDHSLEEKVEWEEAFKQADIVLDVKDIEKYGKRLGNNVTYRQITNGIHDLILSEKSVRDEAYRTLFEWLESQICGGE